MRTIAIRYTPKAEDIYGYPIGGTVEVWACNREGEGLFSRNRLGNWTQHLGTGQTPVFRTPAQLRRFIRRTFGVRDARIVETRGW